MSRDQPRWPEGTPVAPSGKGPGGGRYREKTGGWVRVLGALLERGWHNNGAGRADLVRVAQEIKATDQEIIEQNPDEDDGRPVLGRYGVVSMHGGETAFTYRWDLPDGRSVIHKRFAPSWEVEGDYDYDLDEDYDDEGNVVIVTDAPNTPGLGPGEPDPNYDDENLEQARAEVMASLVAEAIGAPAPPVIYDPTWPTAVWMGYVDTLKVPDRTGRARDSDQAWLIGLLDLLIANDDRFGGNWLIDEQGLPVAIDHGQSMGMTHRMADQVRRGEINPGAGSGFAGRYSDSRYDTPGVYEVTWKDHRLHPDDLDLAEARLVAIDELTEGELDYMRAIIEKLRPHAKGTRRLIT